MELPLLDHEESRRKISNAEVDQIPL